MPNPTKTDENRTALDLLIRGFQVSRILRLVADLGVADKVPREEGCNASELANACKVQPTQLLRVLRVLAAFEIFHVTPNGHVTHSPRSLLLRTDTPDSLHYGAQFWTAPGSWHAWGALDAALTGGVPHQVAWNKSRFQYLHEQPQEARIFDAFMARFPDDRHNALAASYDFSNAALIADIGGGNGEALRQILARFPSPRGIVLDRNDVVEAIPLTARLDGRIDVVAGSFFNAVPAGADIYLLVRVLHDWSDEDCIRILRNCHAAMSPNARLLIVEQILEPDPTLASPTDYLIDTQMMAMFGSARERTPADFDELLITSGFTSLRFMSTESPVSIIEAAVS